MKLADKPFELKKTLGDVIDSLRANGLDKDADDLQKQAAQIASFTSWTKAEVHSLDFGEWPVLTRRFAALMAGKDVEINPPTATASASMAAEPVAASLAG